LTHTSGIVDYTSLAEWMPLWRKDMSVVEIIGLFKDKPFRFRSGNIGNTAIPLYPPGRDH